jgi:hypothetical protein
MSAFDPKQTFIIRAFRIEGPLADCEKRERTLGLPITAWGGGSRGGFGRTSFHITIRRNPVRMVGMITSL